ncbi:type 1 periplasmic binding fold superfamily protein [Ascidiimonas aurantiaca]|uniref:type 1 periplasmic binding fold superfamily protein n=1 Tax=Ascidiimonas aurantiaca TaxID=1685432 RepID=UPI0030EB16ED
MKKTRFLSMLAVTALLFTSCSDDDNPDPVNDKEVITNLSIVFEAEGVEDVTLESEDLDGTDGPDTPEITITGVFQANTTYTGTITVLNQTVTPTENVTLEIREEDDEHQFFFTTTGSLGETTYLDFDDDDNPLGLSFTLATGDAGVGTILVTLRHDLNKDAAGVSEGDITNAGGETDVAQTFSVSVQ